MRPIYDNTVIQIDISDGACHLRCANCTRMIGHHRNPAFMPMDAIITAIESLDGFTGQIGMMGGEPALHPQFLEVLTVWREMVPRRRRALWTSGWKWRQYKADILATFDKDLIHYNDHTQTTGKHQPLLVAIDEVVDDEELRRILIDNCPFQLHWSAAINTNGAFFCEIAAANARVFGLKGYDVVPGWWRKIPAEFRDQVETFCNKCSGALPLPKFSDGRGGRDEATIDVISPGNLERLKAMGSPKVAKGNYRIWDKKLSRTEIEGMQEGWQPREFRDFEAHSPEDVCKAIAS